MSSIDDIKFTPPQLGTLVLSRQRVRALFDRADNRRLACVIAPAGHGKTSLMAERFAALRERGVAAGWVSLDAGDRDPAGFLTSLLIALDRATEERAHARDYAALGWQPLLRAMATRLAPLRQPVHVFLDDYHLAQTNATDAILAKVLGYRQASALRLAIASRNEPTFPLSALKLEEQFLRLGVDDLRFSEDEVVSLFELADIALDGETTRHLTQKTEGWAVALQMARVLLREGTLSHGDLVAFGGRQADMARYLSEQILSSVPSDLQDFLLRTAALPRFNAALAGTFPGTGDGQELLRRLDCHAVPLIAVDHARQWVRCHPVFQEFLIGQAGLGGLDPRAALRAAAEWYGEAEEWGAAIDHALLAEDVGLALDLAEQGGGWRNVYVGSRGLGHQFRRLIDRVPDTHRDRYPRTLMGLAVVAAKGGNLDRARHDMDRIEAGADRSDAALQREVRLISALIALYCDRRILDERLALLEHDIGALDLVEPVQRGLTYNLLCFQYLERTELERTRHYGRLAIEVFRQAHAHFGALHLYAHLGQAHYLDGDLEGTARAYDALIEGANRAFGDRSDLGAIGSVLKAEVFVEAGRYQEAERLLDWALAHLERHDAWFDLLAAAYTALIRIRLIGGGPLAAIEVLDRAAAVAKRRSYDRLERLVARERVRLTLEADGPDQATRLAGSLGIGPETALDRERNALSLRLRGEVPATLWARIWTRSGEAGRALDLLERLRVMQDRPLSLVRRLKLDLLQVQALAAAGRTEAATVMLDEVVLALPSTDYRASFLEEGEALAALLRARRDRHEARGLAVGRLAEILAPAAQGPGEGRLTERERHVLTLLREGHSNKEIGRRLNLSENTVKFHLKNLYGKLEVRTRAGAVSAAHEMGLGGK